VVQVAVGVAAVRATVDVGDLDGDVAGQALLDATFACWSTARSTSSGLGERM
jgi:hypothetical protein